jgi:hypothetical protein
LPNGRRRNGDHYERPDIGPKHHIYRQPSKQKNWQDNPEGSKFKVIEGPPEGSYKFWNPYDILGIILVYLFEGRAPPAANLKEFYLPLTNVYAK